MTKRTLLSTSIIGISAACFGAAAIMAAAPAAHAQGAWPNKAIKLIVPFPPGGPVDGLARVIGPKLGERLGQTIVIDNKAGAGGSIGLDAAIRADPDGYTIGMGVHGAITTLPHLQKVPYNVDEINFVSLVARVPQAIALGAHVKANTLFEFIAMAREKPGVLNFGSAGTATGPHLGPELLMQETGIKITHVPYKGAAPAIVGLLGKEVDMVALDLPAVLPFATRIKIVAINGAKRADALPNVPTTVELGMPNVQAESFYGIIAATGTPVAITRKLHAALIATLNDPDVRSKMLAQGATPSSSSPAEYKKLMQGESVKWAAVLKKGNIKVN